MSDILYAIGGGALTLGGAVLLYLASPNQQLAAGFERRRLSGSLGAIMLAGGLLLLFGVAGPATAVFIWFTLAMAVWSLVPLTAAWLRRPRQNAR
ncbi:MAG TPA: hypothetical protein VNS79_10975 [Sphingobium sp.]|nr:hypothetical protein [Sphingobium sp.]